MNGYLSITCGKCGHVADMDEWTRRPVSGELEVGVFQCPKCNYAFKRQPGGAWRPIYDEKHRVAAVVPERIDLVPVQSRM